MPELSRLERELKHAAVFGISQEWGRLIDAVRAGSDLGGVLDAMAQAVLASFARPDTREVWRAYLDSLERDAPEPGTAEGAG